MINKVVLQFDPSIICLAGYSYGREVYKNQVKGRLDLSQKAYIEFPDSIVQIASSFVQGFFKEIAEEIGLQKIGDSLELICNDKLKDSIMSDLR